jgi:hypothetical protein
VLKPPFVIGLQQLGSDQVDDGPFIGEDADDIATALDPAVRPFARIGAVSLGTAPGAVVVP